MLVLNSGVCQCSSVTEICAVVSAVPVPDLSEQFTPPETAPPALVGLIQAIEKRGIFIQTSQDIHLLSVTLPLLSFHLRATVSLSPSASCFRASVCTCADMQTVAQRYKCSHKLMRIHIQYI